MNIEIICKTAGIFGGIKSLYRVASYLQDADHAVVVNVSDGTFNDWFVHNIPENKKIEPDIRICPETWQQPANCKNILYVQAQFDPPIQQYNGSSFKYTKIVTTTDFLTDELSRAGYQPDYIIPYGFDTSLFYPDTSRRIHGRIGYMPRKGKQEIDLIISSSPDPSRFYCIDGLTEPETIEALQTCDYFLATSRTEGFGMPPLEASLCGCLIIGYHGKGGKKWLTPEAYAPCQFPQEFNIQIELADQGKYEEQRQKLQRTIRENLTMEKERLAWLNVINDITEV